MNEIDPYKIPAYKRKGKITAKNRSSNVNATASYRTLFDRESKLIKKKKKTLNIKIDSRSDQLALKKKLLTKRPLKKSGFSALSSFEKKRPALPTSSTQVDPPEWRKMQLVGQSIQFFDKINVVALSLEKSIKLGDRILFQSEDGLFEQSIESMQIDHQDVQKASRGDNVGMRVKFKPMLKGWVYKVMHERHT